MCILPINAAAQANVITIYYKCRPFILFLIIIKMRLLYFFNFLVMCESIPRIWRDPCLKEFNVNVPNTGCSKKELFVLVDLVLFETNDSKEPFDIFVQSHMNFLNVDLATFHITAFYIKKSQQSCRPGQSLASIRKLLELIRKLRCEVEVGIRPIPWRHLKARIRGLDLCNKIFEEYLTHSLRNFLYEFKRKNMLSYL